MQVKGDFDALLSVSPREGPAQRHKPVALNLRKRSSFNPQGSVDSAGSFVSAASSASESEGVRQAAAAEDSEDSRTEDAASMPVAEEGAHLSTAARAGHATNGTAIVHLDNGAYEAPLQGNGSGVTASEADKEPSSEHASHVEPEAPDHRPALPNGKDSDAAAQLPSAAPTASPASPGPADGFADALEGLRLQPRESAELPVSTLRAGCCLSGYVSAEDEPLPGSAAHASSTGRGAMQDISADELDLLAAASRAGEAGSSGRSDSRRDGEEASGQESGGGAEAAQPLSSSEAPSFSAWEPRDARGDDGLGKGSDEEEGQELGVWRGGSQDSVPTSAAGSSLDSHAASSFELRSIGAEAAEVHQPNQVRHVAPS